MSRIDQPNRRDVATGPHWKRAALAVLLGGTLLQVGGCTTSLGAIALSLFESSVLTVLFGRGF